MVIAGGGSLSSAQVFDLSGAASTLYQASGGSITIHARSYDTELGAGSITGRLMEGARLTKVTRRATYILGDDRIGFELPTDIFDTSHFLMARGVGLSFVHGRNNYLLFSGATATDFNSPLFNGAKTNDLAALCFLKRRLGPRWQLFSNTIVSRKTTAIEAIQWKPSPRLGIALAAGQGANSPYAAASLSLVRPWISLDAAYIQAGQQFHRVALVHPQLAEPDRGNLRITLKPNSFLTFSGGHQNYLVPQYPALTNRRSSVDEASVGLRVYRTQVGGAFYHSTYQTESNHAVSILLVRDFGERFHVMTNYLASRPRASSASNSLISTISEQLTSRLTVNQTVTTSGGRTGTTFGGQLISNLATVSAGYETFYVPANNRTPFEQALVMDVTLNLFGRLALHGSSFVDPNGRLRNTLDAHVYMWRGQSSGPLTEHVLMEPAVMRGCVSDSNGALIEGAALLIDEKLVYTDSNGCFFLREHRVRTHRLTIVLTEFLAGGNWHVITAPQTMTSHRETEDVELAITVVLARVKVEPSIQKSSPVVP